MYTISFDEVINFYRKNNDLAYRRLVEAAKSDMGIVPFVGAGLSIPFGIRQWSDVLMDAKEYVFEQETKDAIKKMIEDKQLIEAAQAIYESFGLFLDELPEMLGKADLSDEKLYPSAAYLLPWLFPNQPVITTNFDSILEQVYSKHGCGFSTILPPKSITRLTQVHQNNLHALLKLHGSIDTAVDLDALVFTEEQYKAAYGEQGYLVAELKQWYTSRHLLFLGCSLEIDRTLDVLQSLVDTGMRPRHFAILGCAQSEVQKRSAQLGKLGIIPIFYNINNHDAVPVILERLLEDINNAAYRQLCSVRSLNRSQPKKVDPLLYDADFIAFTGRQAETEALNRFFDCDTRTLWWAVTGPGGMGKSRLVYEFANSKHRQGCYVRWISSRELPNLSPDWVPETPPALVVLDDVQAHMETIGRWLCAIADHPRSEKLRILLLEREGTDLASADWMRGMSPDGDYDDMLRDWCFDEKFLHLEPLGDPELETIMISYAAARKKTLNAPLLLKTLERVDPTLKRPLYALAIADARCEDKDPTSWNREQVLDRLLSREIRFCKDRLIGAGYKKFSKTMETELFELLARSCIQGFLFLDSITDKDCPKLFAQMDRLGMDYAELFACMGIYQNATLRKVTVDQDDHVIKKEEVEREIITLSCPDLIKEYLVLKQITDKKKPQLLLSEGWERNPGRIDFLIRLLRDFPDILKDQSTLWDSVISATPPEGRPAYLFGMLLWGIASEIPSRTQATADRLAVLYEASGEKDPLALPYAAVLFYCTIDQSPEKVQEAVKKLEEIYGKHPDNQDMVAAYAKALVNLSFMQDLDGCQQAVKKLEEIYGKHPDNQDVAVRYAQTLVNLSAKQDLDGRQEINEKLEALYRKYPDNQDVAFQYAKALVNSTIEQDLNGCLETTSKLKELHSKYPDNQDVALEYAQALGIMSSKQDLGMCLDAVRILNELCDQYPDNQDMVVAYAQALFILAFKQELDACLETVRKLKELHGKYPENHDIAVAYAKGMFNLTLHQEERDIPATLSRIVDFLRHKQSVKDEFTEELKKYLEKHPEHEQRYASLLPQ